MAKPEKLSDDDFKKRIDDLLSMSHGAVGTKIADDRIRNLEAYLAEPTGEWAPPEIDDRSDLVATDVADAVEWMLPSLLRVFASSKSAIQVSARRPQFEGKAELVQEVLRWLFWEKLDGFTILYNWIKDGLIQKVGFVRVGYSKASVTIREQYRGITEAQLSGLLSEDEGVEVLGQAQRVEVIEGQQLPVYDVDLQRTEDEGTCTVDSVPPEEMRVDSAARYGSLPKFIAQEYTRPRSELVAEGYPVEDMQGDEGIVTAEQYERLSISSYRTLDVDDDDPDLRVVEAFVRSGPPSACTWERGFIIGDRLMKREAVDDQPFVWQCPAPMPHVFFGHCPADHALEPQRLRTRLIRAVEDNVYLTVNGRTGVVGGDPITMDDMLDSRPGGLVRLRTAQDLVPIVQPDLSAAAWQAVQWGEQWSEQRTGFSRLSKGLSSEAINDTATGVMEITERADMRTELIARHIAAAMGKLLSKLLHQMSSHQDVSQMVKVAGRWEEIDPRDWANHYEVRVEVGLGTGNKDRQAAQLGELQQTQQGMAAAGMVPPQAAIALARKRAAAMGFDNPEEFFPDPPPPAPPQPPQPPLPVMLEQIKGQQAMQELQAKQQAEFAKLQAEQAHAINLERLKAEARQRERLFELAAGVIASRAAAPAVNLVDGTHIDQAAQSPGVTVPTILQTAQEISNAAAAIGPGVGLQ